MQRPLSATVRFANQTCRAQVGVELGCFAGRWRRDASMNVLRKKIIVFLGMMSKFPVAGEVWATVQYLVGFQRLGYDVYYVEAHARTPSMLMERADDDSSVKAADFIARIMR